MPSRSLFDPRETKPDEGKIRHFVGNATFAMVVANLSADPMSDESHFRHSSLREKVLEHLVVGELLRCLWRKGHRDIELLRAEVDAGGYDLVVDCNGVQRHIQLKASHKTAKTRNIPVNTRLMAKPSGCIVWVIFDAETMELGPFYWFGQKPGQVVADLGGRVARHTRGTKKERPAIRLLKRGQFTKIPTMDELVTVLVGEPRSRASA